MVPERGAEPRGTIASSPAAVLADSSTDSPGAARTVADVAKLGAMNPPTPAPIEPDAPRAAPSGALRSWVVLVATASFCTLGLLALSWLAAAAQPDVAIYAWMITLVIFAPALVLAVASFALIVLSARAERRRLLGLAIASLVCQLTALLAVAALQPFRLLS